MRVKHNNLVLEDKTFDVEVSYLMRKECSIKTDDYSIDYDDFEREAFINTELTDWKEEYESTHYTIEELLRELGRFIEKELPTTEEQSSRRRELERMLRDLQGWRVDEEEYIEV